MDLDSIQDSLPTLIGLGDNCSSDYSNQRCHQNIIPLIAVEFPKDSMNQNKVPSHHLFRLGQAFSLQ